jgi:lipopolysaccharide transport protein LptA
MASSRASVFTLRLAAVVIALLGAGAVAQTDRRNLPIEFAQKSLEIDLATNDAVMHDLVITQGDVRIEAAEARVSGGLDTKNSRWTITGNVRIKAEGGSLRSDRAVISFNDNVITRATITGAPAEFEQMRAGSADPARGHAKTIDYELDTGNVSLREGAWLSVGCTEMRSDELVYNIRTQRVRGQALAGGTVGSDGRPRFTVQPGGTSASGNPCSVKTEPKP